MKLGEYGANRPNGHKLGIYPVLPGSYQFVNMSIISGFFDMFFEQVYRIDRSVFPGEPYGIPGGFVLTPGRYVGAEDVVDDGEPFEEKMGRLLTRLHEQMAEARILDDAIIQNLKGFEISE